MITRAGFAFSLDTSLLVGVCVLFVVRLTGLVAHEWLAFVFAGAALVHLLLSWSGIGAATRRMFAGAGSRNTINCFLNFALFADIVIVLLSGFMISRYAAPALGLHIAENLIWRRIHVQASNLAILLTGLHVALNWDWVAAVLGARFRTISRERA